MKAASAGVEDTQLRTHNIAVCATQLDQSALSLSLSLSLCVCVCICWSLYAAAAAAAACCGTHALPVIAHDQLFASMYANLPKFRYSRFKFVVIWAMQVALILYIGPIYAAIQY